MASNGYRRNADAAARPSLRTCLQDRPEFARVGGGKIIDTDVRLIAGHQSATEAQQCAPSSVPEDLYYRLQRDLDPPPAAA